MELHRFLLILDKETLSGNATIQKGLLSDLLQSYKGSNGMKEKNRSVGYWTEGGGYNGPDFLKCSGYSGALICIKNNVDYQAHFSQESNHWINPRSAGSVVNHEGCIPVDDNIAPHLPKPFNFIHKLGSEV